MILTKRFRFTAKARLAKFTAILMVAALCASALASCDDNGSAAEAYQLYRQMMAAMSGVESIDMDMSSAIDIDMGWDAMTMVMHGNIRQVMRSETDVDMAMNMTTNAMGMDMPMTMYFTGGVMYVEMEMFGEFVRYSMPMSLEEALAQQGNISMLDFPENAIRSFDVSTRGGDTQIALTLDGSSVTELLDQAMEMLPALGLPAIGTNMTIGDVTIEATMGADNMLQSYRMAADIAITSGGETFSMSMDTTIIVNSYNDVTIIFPDNLDEFEEMDLGIF